MMNIIRGILLVLVALLVHEAAHILAAKYLGGYVEKIRPFMLGFSAKISGLEKLRAWERYVIYSAGAVANGVVAAWAFTVSHLSYVGVMWLEELAFYSIVLCIFNLIPALPLDGGRILKQFLSNRFGVLRANKIIVRLGQFFSIILITLGIVQMILFNYNLTLYLAGIYIWRKNKEIQPELILDFFRAMEGKTIQERARQMPVKTLYISLDMPVQKAIERLTLDHFVQFTAKKECISISETALLVYIFENNLVGTLEEVFARTQAGQG